MFEEQYQLWLAKQLKTRSGEALRRLKEQHKYSEKLFVEEIWWPAIGNLHFLHAEYEVTNFRDSSYYLDFAYIQPPLRINWEVDDYSSHAKNMDRRGFNYERDRQNQIMLDGWNIYRFPLDVIKERPRQCQQLVLQVMGRLYGGGNTVGPVLSLKEKEIMRLAIRLQRPFTPTEVCVCLGVQGQHARRLLQGLVGLNLLVAASGTARIRTYSLGPTATTMNWI